MSAAQLRSIENDEDRSAPSLWRNRDFVVLWCGQAVSSVGTQVSGLAFPLLVLAITHSAAQTGLIAAVRGIPFVLLTLPAGVLVDRWDRKRLMLWSDVGRAIALGSVPLAMMLGWLTLWQLAVAALLEGTLFTFYNVAEVACLPRIVPREQLGSAVAQSQAIDASSGLVGPALSGALYGLSHVVPFLVDAVSYGASVLSLWLIRTELQEERVQVPLRLWPEMREGFFWLWHHRTMRFLALLMSVLGVLTQSIGAPSTILVLTVPQAVIVILATGNRPFRAARMTVAGRRA